MILDQRDILPRGRFNLHLRHLLGVSPTTISGITPRTVAGRG
jgi:hypothetical protein